MSSVKLRELLKLKKAMDVEFSQTHFSIFTIFVVTMSASNRPFSLKAAVHSILEIVRTKKAGPGNGRYNRTSNPK